MFRHQRATVTAVCIVFAGGLSAVLLTKVAPEALAQNGGAGITRVGIPVTVNSPTGGAQENPSVAIDRMGDMDFAYESYSSTNQNGSGVEIHSRTFDRTASPVGSEFQVNSYTTGDQTNPCVMRSGSGNTTDLSFFDAAQTGGAEVALFFQQFINGIKQFNPDRQVNEATVGNNRPDSFCFAQPGATSPADRKAFFGWEAAQTGSGSDVHARGGFPQSSAPIESAAAGIRVASGNEFQVNTYTTGYQRRGDGCAFSDDSFVITWFSSDQDGDAGGIFGQRFDAANNPVGTEFQINSYTTGNQDQPKVACDNTGFVVAWSRDRFSGMKQDGSSFGVSVRRFDRSANSVGTEFLAKQRTSGRQVIPGDIAGDGAGNFVVVWRDYSPFTVSMALRGFAADLTPISDDIPVVAPGVVSQPIGTPSMDMNAAGEFVVTWTDYVGGGNETDVLAQLFTLDTGATTTTTMSVPTTTTTLGTTTTTLPAPACGDPSANPAALLIAANRTGAGVARATITATDALLVLTAAVGSFPCNACVCDVNGMGGTTATDALVVLQFAVGQGVSFNCPPCM